MTKHYLEMTNQEQEYALDCAQTFLKWTREDIKDVTKSFFKIGFRLYEARAYKYYEALGYPDIETLAEEEFGFKRSTTYGLIQVYENICIKYGHNTMDEKYIGYDYSKLLELCKVKYSMDTFLLRIKPTDSVRDIRQYVRFWNDYSAHHLGDYKLTLQEWKAQQQQEQPPALPPAPDKGQIEGQVSIDEVTEETDFDTWLEKQPEGTFVQGGGLDNDYKPTAPVQTSRLRDTAEEKQTETKTEKPKEGTSYIYSIQTFSREELAQVVNKTLNIFEEKVYYQATNGLHMRVPASMVAEQLYYKIAQFLGERSVITKPKTVMPYQFDEKRYTLQNRKGVRDFLADYQNWYEAIGFKNFYFTKVYSCFLKDRTYIYACERKIYNGTTLQLGKAETEVTYYFNAFKGDGVSEISKNQFEQYCAEHKDEL